MSKDAKKDIVILFLYMVIMEQFWCIIEQKHTEIFVT